MYIKVLNNNKVKVIVEKDDIEDFETIDFDSCCENTKNAVAVLLVGIFEQTGLNFFDSKIMIETLKAGCQSYYVIITRITKCESHNNHLTDSGEANMYLYKLNYIEDAIDIAELIKSDSNIVKYSKLYKYQNQFYLCLYLNNDNTNTDKFIDNLDNSYTRCKWNIFNDVILHEWGSLINIGVIEKMTAAV